MKPSNRNNQNALIKGQGHVPGWAQNTSILRTAIVTLLSDTLRDVSVAGISFEEQIIEIVARNSLQSPLPDELCQMVQMFVLDFHRKLESVDKGIVQLHQCAEMVPRSHVCYAVFHDGQDHYYHDELPKHVLKLRDSALFWINWAQNEFRSSGEPQEKSDCPSPRALQMLRFLCLKQNAGRENVPFLELFSHIWCDANSADKRDIRNSINVAQNEINNYSAERFISDESKKDNAKVVRIRGKDMFNINDETPKECCIIKVIKAR